MESEQANCFPSVLCSASLQIWRFRSGRRQRGGGHLQAFSRGKPELCLLKAFQNSSPLLERGRETGCVSVAA